MSTTIFPLNNSGPDDDEYCVTFPEETGRGMGHTVLRESKGPNKSAEPKVKAKTFIKEAMGSDSKGKKKVKKGSKPKNLRAAETTKKSKLGSFGEKYSAVEAGKSKGERVAGKD